MCSKLLSSRTGVFSSTLHVWHEPSYGCWPQTPLPLTQTSFKFNFSNLKFTVEFFLNNTAIMKLDNNLNLNLKIVFKINQILIKQFFQKKQRILNGYRQLIVARRKMCQRVLKRRSSLGFSYLDTAVKFLSLQCLSLCY